MYFMDDEEEKERNEKPQIDCPNLSLSLSLSCEKTTEQNEQINKITHSKSFHRPNESFSKHISISLSIAYQRSETPIYPNSVQIKIVQIARQTLEQKQQINN